MYDMSIHPSIFCRIVWSQVEKATVSEEIDKPGRSHHLQLTLWDLKKS